MKKILVVEDDPYMQSAIASVLDAGGYESVVVGTARAAVDALRNDEIDLAIVDLFLPGEDGLNILSEWQDSEKIIMPHIIAISGGGPTFTASLGLAAARSLGVQTTLYKPFSKEELLLEVRHLLGEVSVQR